MMDKEDIRNIRELHSYLIKNGHRPIGISEQEIELIEHKYSTHLPFQYKEFLKYCGKSCDGFMEGSTVYFEDLLDIPEGMEELLKENPNIELPENSFVFWMHQGYQFAFFNIDSDDDPSIFYFSESKRELGIQKVEERLTSFFVSQLEWGKG